MAQGTGSTAPTFDPILMRRYEKMVPIIIHRERPILAALNDFGTNTLNTKNKRVDFGHQVTRTNNQRWHGADDLATYPRRDGGLKFANPYVTYKKMYAPQQLNEESLMEAGPDAAMVDGVKRVLEDVPESVGADYERLFLQQQGDGVLFKSIGVNTAGSAVTCLIKDLGGISGQEIGHVLGNMSLTDFQISWVTAGTLPQNLITGGASKMTSYTETYNSEAAIFATLASTTAASSQAILSRDDLGSTGSYTANSHPIGLPGLVDDYGQLATFQGVTSTTDPLFVSKVLANSGTKEAITEAFLSRMVVAAKVRGTNTREKGAVKHVFIVGTLMEESIAELSAADRRFGAPMLFDRAGVKPYLGVDTPSLRFKNIPFFSSPLAQRNSIYLLDTEDCFCVHNGPRWGQWIVRDHPIETGPQRQWVYMTYNDFGMWKRNTSVRRDDLTTPTYM